MKDRLKKIEEELKKSSKQLFKSKSKDVEEELDKETYLGNPKNLVDREDKEGD